MRHSKYFINNATFRPGYSDWLLDIDSAVERIFGYCRRRYRQGQHRRSSPSFFPRFTQANLVNSMYRLWLAKVHLIAILHTYAHSLTRSRFLLTVVPLHRQTIYTRASSSPVVPSFFQSRAMYTLPDNLLAARSRHPTIYTTPINSGILLLSSSV